LILDEGMTGGQLVLTHEIANYPDVESTSGYMLGSTMAGQSRQFGCKVRPNVRITRLLLEEEIKEVEINGRETFNSESVILTPGGGSRTLGFPGEEEFEG
jgi:thioredoxin reductase (NADPH)